MTPDRLLLEATAEAVELPSATGYLEALYGAAPLLAELGAGDGAAATAGPRAMQKFFVGWGFVEVLPERVTILAEIALHPEEIDKAEATSGSSKKARRCGHEAGDDGAKYDQANAMTRQADEKMASAEYGVLKAVARAVSFELVSSKFRVLNKRFLERPGCG